MLRSLKWSGHSHGTPWTPLFNKPQSGLLLPLFDGAQLPVWHIVKHYLKYMKRVTGTRKEREREALKDTNLDYSLTGNRVYECGTLMNYWQRVRFVVTLRKRMRLKKQGFSC